MYVSLGANRGARKQEGLLVSSSLPPPSRDQLPMMLLLAKPHFDRLFRLLQQLSTFGPGDQPMVSLQCFGLKSEFGTEDEGGELLKSSQIHAQRESASSAMIGL